MSAGNYIKDLHKDVLDGYLEHFSMKELKELEGTYSMFDKHQDGELTVKELQNVLNKLGQQA